MYNEADHTLQVSVKSDQDQLNKEYPLYGAVNRAASRMYKNSK